MFVIFFLMVGLAWLVVGVRQAPSREGRAILSAIRDNGLAHYWGENWAQQYIHRSTSGREMGGIRLQASVDDEGVWQGLEEWVIPEWQLRAAVQWKSSNDAAQGVYRGQVLSPARSDVQVIYEGRELKVVDNLRQAVLTVTAGENFLPSPLQRIAMIEVFRRGKPARFDIISYQSPVTHPATIFGSVFMTPGESSVTVLHSGQMGGFERVYHFDDEGQVERIDMEDGSSLIRVPLPAPAPTRASVPLDAA